MGEIRGERTVERFGPAGAFLLSDEEVELVGEGPKVFPVRVQVNGHDLELRLARMGGRNCIGLRRELREKASLELGGTYEVVITRDSSVRTVEVPEDLATALATAGLAERFAALAPSHRKEFCAWVSDAKRAQTRADRVAAAVQMVAEGRKRS